MVDFIVLPEKAETMDESLPQKPVLRRRSMARLLAVQALYQIEITAAPLEEVLNQFKTHHLKKKNRPFSLADKPYFSTLLEGAASKQLDLDPLIQTCLAPGWPLERLNAVTRAILRLGAYELLDNLHLSPAIILNEYIDIAHAFFDEKEPAFINGVLNCLVQKLRPLSHEKTS